MVTHSVSKSFSSLDKPHQPRHLTFLHRTHKILRKEHLEATGMQSGSS